jgi:hypothetical protein
LAAPVIIYSANAATVDQNPLVSPLTRIGGKGSASHCLYPVIT